MSPEVNHSPSGMNDLLERLDAETQYLSGGFHKSEAFQEIVAQGESALPELLNDKDRLDWARMQAVWVIADNIGKPIEYPEEVAGYYQEVRDHTLKWGKAQGYIPEEVAE